MEIEKSIPHADACVFPDTQPEIELLRLRLEVERLKKAIRLCVRNLDNPMGRGEISQIMEQVLNGEPSKRFDELTKE